MLYPASVKMANRNSPKCVFLLFSSFLSLCYGSHYGIIYAEAQEDLSSHGYYCMMYNPRFHPVSRLVQDANKYLVVDLTPDTYCDETTSQPVNYDGKAVAISRGNCTFSEKAHNVQATHAAVALIVSKRQIVEPSANQTSDYSEVNITVALIDKKSFTSLMGLGKQVQIQLYAPEAPRLDYNLILIWVIAVGTIVVGAFWSGVVKNKQRVRRFRISQGRGRSEASATEVVEADEEEQETFDVSPKLIFIFVVLMCAMLVSLYFLYDYLVYFIIAIFTVASSTALYACLKLVLIRLPCIGNCRIPPNRLPLLNQQPEIRRLVLAAMCLGVGIWWAVERKADYSWILQDLLGIVFCVHMLKTVRLSSLKACTVLLVLLFFYDIFFVFITPLLTKTGQSVMVDVATGGDSTTGEMLPMVFRVPRFDTSVLSVCSLPYSLLGFGDILVPGLLVSYCHGFDLKVQSGRIYFIGSVVAYGLGLVLTFVALALMDSGQPALLYLVPCTLLTTFALALKRREVKHMWRGELPMPPQSTITTNTIDDAGSTTVDPPNTTITTASDHATHNNSTPAVLNGVVSNPKVSGLSAGGGDPVDSNSSFSSDNENQYLIQR